MTIKPLLKPIVDRLNQVKWAFLINGIILVILAILIAYSVRLLQLIVAIAILLIAYTFFYGSYKLHTIKRLLDK